MSDTHVRVSKQGSRASVAQWPEFSIYVLKLGSLLKPQMYIAAYPDFCGIGKVWKLLKNKNHYNKECSVYQYHVSYKVSICGSVWILKKNFYFLLYRTIEVTEFQNIRFLTAISHRGLRNDSFFWDNISFPFSVWTFISLFYLDL